jgi:Ni,Fe-hydrogenase III small subunit
MKHILLNLLRKPLIPPYAPQQSERLKRSTHSPVNETISLHAQKLRPLLRRSLAIREVDCGSDNAAEMELSSLTGPCYDLEQYGISFVASPRHADALIVTGAVTHAMADALKRTYEATPHPKLVIAVGDDACTGGIFQGSYAVYGGVDQIIPVDLKIPGNPPSPDEILSALKSLMYSPDPEKSRNK